MQIWSERKSRVGCYHEWQQVRNRLEPEPELGSNSVEPEPKPGLEQGPKPTTKQALKMSRRGFFPTIDILEVTIGIFVEAQFQS